MALGDRRGLSDDRRVWLVYIVRPNKENEKITSPKEPDPIAFESSYIDPEVDLKGARLRGIALGAQDDGSLAFWDLKATWRPSA
jgi:hypothetical protein